VYVVFAEANSAEKRYCIVLYLYIYIALLAVQSEGLPLGETQREGSSIFSCSQCARRFLAVP